MYSITRANKTTLLRLKSSWEWN